MAIKLVPHISCGTLENLVGVLAGRENFATIKQLSVVAGYARLEPCLHIIIYIIFSYRDIKIFVYRQIIQLF